MRHRPSLQVHRELLARTGMRTSQLAGPDADAVVVIGAAHRLRVPLGKLRNDRYVPLPCTAVADSAAPAPSPPPAPPFRADGNGDEWRPVSRRPLPPVHLPAPAVIGCALAMVALVLVAQLTIARSVRIVGMLAIPPFGALLQPSRRLSTLVSVTSVVAAAIGTSLQTGVSGYQHIVTISIVVSGALLAIWLSSLRARLGEALHLAEELATIDPLTGVLNRGAAFGRLESLTALRPGVRPSLALLMIDVDHLKLVNDVHGHAAGDRVLAGAAQRMRAELRAGDVFGRYGGDEFLAVLVGGEPAEADAVAARVCAAAGEGAAVTVSVGLATILEEEQSPMPALERADLALYRAKAAGRGRVARL